MPNADLISEKVKILFATSDTLASDILNKIYPDISVTIEQRIDRAKAVVYIISRHGEKEVLRLSVSPLYSVQNIAAAYRAWEQIGIPVPHAKAEGGQGSIEYLLMEYMADSPFTFDVSLDVQVKVASRMGSLLARMREVRLEGFGHLDENGQGELESWSELVKSYYSHDWITAKGYLTVVESLAIRRIKDSAFALDSSVLLHGDYKLKNVFVAENGDITAVTDPKPLAGDPLWDFALFNHFVYREQARRNKSYDDAFYVRLRDVFKQSYEKQLGRRLKDDEMRRIMSYEILIDAGKAEKLIQGRLDEAEGESEYILDYLRHKIRRVSL